MRILLISISIILFNCLSHGQATIYDESTVIYKKEIHGGFQIHGHGWGLTFTKGYYKTAHSALQWTFDFVGMKHPKEDKRFNPYEDNARAYSYGKENNLYILRSMFGKRNIVTDKFRKNGVEFGYSYGLGASLGITKPVYLEIGKGDYPFDYYIAIEKYDPTEHFIQDIIGRASWTHGIDEINIHPGAHAKFSLFVEYSPEQTGIKGLEAGISLDAYPEDIPIMATLDEGIPENKKLFLNFFVNVFFGKKYN